MVNGGFLIAMVLQLGAGTGTAATSTQSPDVFSRFDPGADQSFCRGDAGADTSLRRGGCPCPTTPLRT